MPITYNPDTNTITIVGTKDGQPYTFEDIYQADVNNGWNKFTKLSEGVYKTTAKLQFGDGSTETWFEEKGTTLVIENTASKDWDAVVMFKANCKAQFGEYALVNGEKVVYNGVTFVLSEFNYSDAGISLYEGCDVKFYACRLHITKNSKRWRFGNYAKEFIGGVITCYVTGFVNATIENVLVTGIYGHFSGIRNTVVNNVVFISKMGYCVYSGNTSQQYTNCTFTTTGSLASISNLQQPNIIKFINCKANKWSVSWYLAEGSVSGELHRIYAVRFKVTDVNGNPLMSRIVKVYNRNGDLVAELQTDENGLTEEVEILYAKLTNPYSDGKWHTFDEDDWEYFNPYVVEVWYGSELEYKGILTELDVDSTFIQITVKPSSLTLNDVIKEIKKHDAKMTALKFV